MSFLEFCGNSTFWDDAVLESSTPKFTTCLVTTVPAIGPVLWVALTFPYFIVTCSRAKLSPLPIRSLSVFKTSITVLITILRLFTIYANAKYGYNCDGNTQVPTSYILSHSLLVVSFIYIAVVTQIYRRQGVLSSFMLWLFWIFVVLCEIIPLEDNIIFQPTCLSSILQYVTFGLSCVQVILYGFRETTIRYGYTQLGKSTCPKPDASVFSKLFLWWFTPVVRDCYKRTITKDDLWDQHPEIEAEKVGSELYSLWKEEEHIAQKKRLLLTQSSYRGEYSRNGHIPTSNGGLHGSKVSEETSLLRQTSQLDDKTASIRPSLYKCCFKLYFLEWFSTATFKLLCDVAALVQPLILQAIISETEKPGKDRIFWYGFTLGIFIFIAGQLNAIFYLHAAQRIFQLGLKVKTALIGVIYRKTLKVSNSVKKNYTVGEVVNLVSVDCQRIQDAFSYANEIVSFFFLITVGLIELWNVMGLATLGCILVIIILACLNALFGKLQEKYLMAILRLKGIRCKLLNEIICGIKVIKMYAWEPYFSKKIRDIREQEKSALRKIANVTACSIVAAANSPFMMNFPILLIYSLSTSGEPFEARKAFLALSVVNIMRFPLTVIPFVITGVIQAFVSLKRIQQFLWSDEVNSNNVLYLKHSDYAISMDNCSFSWEKENNRPTLSRMNINVLEGKLIAVVGQVGSGKSSFIASILGEMEKLEGEVKVKGSIAYVSQEAWIQNMTVKNNILFGHKYNEKKYKKVIEGCCLETDLKILSAGDMTEIGERGINLSGGQKQRVNLARAVYSNRDIYLFDDPLSAVDSHVGKDLFKRIIGPEGMLRHKTRILVTHGVHWLPKVDEIIVLNNGRISERGSYEELVRIDGPFAQFLRTYLLQEDDIEDNDIEVTKIKDDMWDEIEALMSDGVTSDGMPGRKSIKNRSRRNSIISDKSISSPKSKSKRCRTESERTVTFTLSMAADIDQIVPDLQPLGQLIEEEKSNEGSVNAASILEYVRAMGWMSALFAFVTLVGQQGLQMYSNFWINYWTEDSFLTNASLINTPEYNEKKNTYLVVYGLLGIGQALVLLTFGLIVFRSFIRATGTIHDRGLNCVFRSPMSFFDTTPIGRIMNRFSSDIDVLDNRFPLTFRMIAMMGFILLGTVVVIIITTPITAAVVVPLLVLYAVFIKLYLPAARQLKRIESVTRSPVFNYFSETISGTSIIRAYNCVDRFIEELNQRVNLNATFYFAANTGMGWVAVYVVTLGNFILLAVALFGVLSTDVTGGDIGLSLTYAFQIIIAMNIVVRGVSEMQMNVVSIERCEEYMYLPSEADWLQRYRPPVGWPQKGTIKFMNYKTRYRPGLDLVLKGINCFIRNGERVGIVGRTGAGKSSLTQALFRLIEPAEGSINIDEIKTTTIGLHDLRSKITILPQDPVLFSDTLRVNLDPLGKFSDREIWKALECAHLKQFAMSQNGHLNSELGEGGNNLSVGQRQLVCLARTLLHKTNILILDEATAAVDMKTDDLIQETITKEFSDCTILSIAHRLNTVLDYDRIMVMSNGMIAEFDEPDKLLKDEDGIFYSMAKDAGLI